MFLDIYICMCIYIYIYLIIIPRIGYECITTTEECHRRGVNIGFRVTFSSTLD